MGTICFKTNYLTYEISRNAQNVFFGGPDGQNHVLTDSCAYIINTNKKEIPATSAEFADNILVLGFADETKAEIIVCQNDTYITFTLKSVSRDDFLAIAFVNIKLDGSSKNLQGTLIGMTLSTRMLEHPGDNKLLRAEAYPRIGLFSTHRSKFPAKAAIIGAPKSEIRKIECDVLDEIPDGELPKSKKGGPYADLSSKVASGSYTLFTDAVTMDNIDSIISEMRKLGLTQVNLHHYGHYVQGDFRCREDSFPNGMVDFKKVVDRFHHEGILVGMHSYCFFVVPESTYLSPIPHKDLDTIREFTLADDVGIKDFKLSVLESTDGVTPEVGYVLVNSPYLWIDDEIIQFESVDNGSFKICKRGVFGTLPTEHKKGASVRQLKQYFFLPMAKAGSSLFYEIARNTGRFYNECGADIFYLDALDGSFILDGEDYVWYHAIDFIREMFSVMDTDPIFDCCHNLQYTGSWFVRSRYGAIDVSLMAHMRQIDAHVKYNVETAERMGVTPELGWFDLYPKYDNTPFSWQNEAVFQEDLEYLCSKAFATGASLTFLENFKKYSHLPCAQIYSDILKKYELYRNNNFPLRETKEYLIKSGNGAYLHNNILYKVQYPYGYIERKGEGLNVENPFSTQNAAFRIDALYSAEESGCDGGITLCEFDENEVITNKKIRFDTPICAGENKGIGVWCKGDGSNAIVCISIRNFAGNRQKTGEHYIRVDFEGWRYFAFHENQNGSMPLDEWPLVGFTHDTYTELQKAYGFYRPNIDYNAIDGVDIIVKGSDNICLKSIELLPFRKTVWRNPTISVGDTRMTVYTELKSGNVLIYDGTRCSICDYDGNVLSNPDYSGECIIPHGKSRINMTHSDNMELTRAKITLTLLGDKLQ